MSAIAVFVLALVAVGLVAMLIAGLRRSALARSRAAAIDYDGQPFRSHAEASRARDRRT